MRVENPDALAYYCNESRSENWTVRQLERNIKSPSSQRLLSSQSTTDKDKSQNTINTRDFIKDPHVLEFLQLPEKGDLKTGKLTHHDIGQMEMYGVCPHV